MFWNRKKKLIREEIKETVPVQEVNPAEIPVPEPEEAPAEAPVPAPEEIPAEAPVPAPEEAPAEAPVPMPEEEPAGEIPAPETPVPEPGEVPAEEISVPEPEEGIVEETPVPEPEEVPVTEPPASEPEEIPAEEPPVTIPEEAIAREPVAPTPEEPPAPEPEVPTPEEAPAPIPEVPAPEEPPVPEQEPPAPEAPPAREQARAIPRYEPTQEEIDARLPAREPEPRHGHGLGILVFLLLLAVGGAYYYGKMYAETHFIHGTYINGENVSNMTVQEVEDIFEKKVSDFHLDLHFRGDVTETIEGKDFSYHSAPDGSVGRILASQDPYWWPLGFFQKREAQIPENKTFDEAQLREAVLALPELQESSMVLPTDAYVTFQDDAFTIVPHTEGSLLDGTIVADAAVLTVSEEQQLLEVEPLGAYAVPAVRMDDEDLVEYRDDLNRWISGSMVYHLPSGEEMSLGPATIKEWLSVDEDGRLYKDDDVFEDKIEIFVDNLAMKVNTVGDSRSFKTTNAGEITMKGGDYGYSVNKPAEREALAELLEEGESDDREPMYYTREYGDDHSINGGIGDTYIEANLSSQHVWIYVDGKMVCDSDCVSGNVNLGRGTPTGVFQILYKDTDVDLKGQPLANGKYSYISHVNYWMPFYGGCGFHDADWRTRFGGSIYTYDGSHGCINLPKEIAPTFYKHVQKGMPVVVYY